MGNTPESLTAVGLVQEIQMKLRQAKESRTVEIENRVALETLDRLAGTTISPTQGNVSESLVGIDIFINGILEDYVEVLEKRPELAADILKYVQIMKQEIVNESERIRADYANLSLNLQEDPRIVASTRAEASMIEEAMKFLKFKVEQNDQKSELVPEFFSKSGLPTVINVGIKNLIADFSTEEKIRRPVIRKIISLVNYRAQQ